MGNIPYDQVCAMYQQGFSGPAVAEHFGISTNYVYTLLKNRRISRRGQLSPERRADAIEAYNQGENVTHIARRYGISKEAMRQLLIRRGIAIRGVGEVMRRHSCDDHFFDNVDSESSAYWLGFIGADGCVIDGRLLVVKLTISDKNHLEALRLALNATNQVRVRDPKDGSKPRASIEINSRQLVAGLASHGIHPAKSLVYDWPHFLPDRLLPHYLRGYFDGDGCFGMRRSGRDVTYQAYATICGSEQFLLWYRYYLQTSLGFNANKLKRDGAIHTLTYAGNRQIAKFAHLLYDGATIYMPRKRERVAHLL